MADEDSSSGGTVRQRVVLELFSPQPTNLAGLQTGLKMLGAMEAQMRNIETRWNRMFSGAAGGAALGGLQAAAKGVTGQLTSAVTQANVLSQKFDKLRDPNRVIEQVSKSGPGITTKTKFGTAGGGEWGKTEEIETKNFQKAQSELAKAAKREVDETMDWMRQQARFRQMFRTNAEQAGRDRTAREIRGKRTEGRRLRDTYGDEGFGSVVKANQEFQKYIATSQKAHAANEKLAESHRYLGRNMLENIGKVTAWTSSVAVLYGAVNLARNSLETLITTGFQQARLTQVFKGTAYEASRLTDDILRLASANGRSASEAMESAIQWSRLGLNRVQVNEAVRVSLMAANVAEISAAQATEHLASLTAVYGLRATQLNSVLGMLNNTSNTYNVTNKDLLDGLTRTAAVARQAGIPLAELIGLLGAGVGATGQTGSNIGNAIKSMTGSLSSADKLKSMREQFGFEGTTGTGELQNMSELLGELFVKYNQMVDAEKRSFVFGTFGKNQASRAAALLDNYVKAQVIAINAQLNLNSAEEENARIKATLQSQLKGLTAEWARFVNTQGGRGAAQGLTEIAKGMKNILNLANAPGLNLAFTAIQYLGIGIAAKLAMASFQMAEVGKKGSYVANSLAGIKNMALEVGAAYGRVADKGASMWWAGGRGKDKAGSLMGAPLDITKATGRLDGKLVQTEDGLRRIKVSADGTSASLVKLSGNAQFARVAMAGMADVILPMLAVMVTLKGLNITYEALGFSSDRVNARMLKLGENAERAESAANAQEMRGRLMGNMQKVFEDAHTSESTRLALAKQLSEAIAPYASGDTNAQKEQKDALRAARLKELQDIGRIQNAEQMLAKSRSFFAREEGEAFAARAAQRQRARDDYRAQAAAADAEIRRLSVTKLTKRLFGGRIKEFEDKKSELTNKRLNSYLEDSQDQNDAMSKWRESDVGFKSYAASQKAMLGDLKSLWDDLPGDGHLDKLNKEMAYQEHGIQLLKQELKIKNDLARASGLPDTSIEEAKAKVAAEGEAIAAAKEQALAASGLGSMVADMKDAASRQAATSLGGPLVGLAAGVMNQLGRSDTANEVADELAGKTNLNDQQKQFMATMDALKARSEANERANAAIKKAQSEDKYRRDSSDRDETQKNLEAEQVALNANRTRIARMETADRRSLTLRFGAAQIAGYGIGEGEGEQTANRIRGLQVGAVALQAAGFATGSENLRLQAMQHGVELQDEMVKGALRLMTLEQEHTNLIIQKNREYQRGLLTAGPAELLRKLAVNQFRKAGMNAGGFFAFDSGARQDIMSLPENSQEVQSNLRNQRALRSVIPNETLEQWQNRGTQASRARGALYGDLAPEINESARIAAGHVTSLGNAAQAAAIALREIVAIRGTLTSQPPGVPQAGNYNPRMSLAG